MGRRIDPCSDYGFKIIFGKEENKRYLISFLNSLFKGEYEITDVTYINKEQNPDSGGNRTMVYDVYCTTNDGRHVICEMQNTEKERFGTRSLCYASNALVQQCRKGKEWQYDDIKTVVCISVLNFISPELSNYDSYRKDVTLMDCRTKEEFSDDLRLIYLTLPKFNKEELECSDELEHWLFSLKHMETMEQLPTGMKGTIFEDLWNKMDYYSLPFEDRIMYDRMMMRKADEKNSLATSRKRGREEGLKEGEAKGLKEGQREEKLSTARKMIAMDFPLSQISQITGLSLEELEQLK